MTLRLLFYPGLILMFGCSSFLTLSDTAMPDRFGLGASTGTGSFDGTIQDVGTGHAGGELWKGDADITGASAWLEWDIPSANGTGRGSFAGMRNQFMTDFTPKKSEGLLTVTKVIDEETGAETWEFGATEALTGALGTLIAALGWKGLQRRKNGNGKTDEKK